MCDRAELPARACRGASAARRDKIRRLRKRLSGLGSTRAATARGRRVARALRGELTVPAFTLARWSRSSTVLSLAGRRLARCAQGVFDRLATRSDISDVVLPVGADGIDSEARPMGSTRPRARTRARTPVRARAPTRARLRGGCGWAFLNRAHTRIAVRALPCGCDVTEQAAELQADAILDEHELAEKYRAAAAHGSSGNPHVLDPGAVAKARAVATEGNQEAMYATCVTCSSSVDVTELVRAQLARRVG